MLEINSLPRDMLMEVFRWLPPQDIKMAVLVSKKWMSLAEDPNLWKWTKVTVKNRDDINMLFGKRINQTEVIRIGASANWKAEDWETFFRAVIMLPKLKEIVGTGHNTNILSDTTLHNMWSVKPGLFAMALTKLEVVNLYGTSIHKGQITELFEAMSRNSQLKKLNLRCQNLSCMEPGKFARAVAGLEEVKLTHTDITNRHVQALFKKIYQTCQLKHLDIRCCANILTSVEPDLFAMVVSKLEVAILYGTGLSDNQITALCRVISQSSNLKKLWIQDQGLSCVEPKQLAMAITKIENVGMSGTYITRDQQVELFNQMDRNSQIKSLDLGGLTLSDVEPILFASVLARLEYVNLQDAVITNMQKAELFSEVCQSTTLRKLKCWNMELSSVDSEILGTAVARLEEVDIGHTELTHEQLISIITHAQGETRLKKLTLSPYRMIRWNMWEVLWNTRAVLGDIIWLGLIKLNDYFDYIALDWLGSNENWDEQDSNEQDSDDESDGGLELNDRLADLE